MTLAMRFLAVSSVLCLAFASAAADGLSVTITSPENGAFLGGCSDVTISSEPKIDDGTISYVYFYRDGTQIGRARTEPWEYVWENVVPGIYTLTAKVRDANRNEAWSDPVKITVGDPIKGNKIINGGFDCRTWPWSIGLTNTAQCDFELWNDFWFNDSSYAAILIEDGSDTDWHIQLLQNVPLDSGHTYEISFWADAEVTKNIAADFQENGDDWTVHWWQGMTVERLDYFGPYIFDCMINDPTAQFKFILGGNTIDIYIDDVRVIDLNATAVEGQELADAHRGPFEFQLSPNYPNPFNAETFIPFKLDRPAEAVLEIYNVNGQKVRTLSQGTRTAGWHSIRWDGTDAASLAVPTGVYIARLQVGNDDGIWMRSGKLLLLR